MHYVVGSCLSWSNSICNFEAGFMRIRGPTKSTASFQRWTLWTCAYKPAHICLLKGQTPRFPHDWLKISSSSRAPTMIGWTIGGRVYWKSRDKVVTHPLTTRKSVHVPRVCFFLFRLHLWFIKKVKCPHPGLHLVGCKRRKGTTWWELLNGVCQFSRECLVVSRLLT